MQTESWLCINTGDIDYFIKIDIYMSLRFLELRVLELKSIKIYVQKMICFILGSCIQGHGTVEIKILCSQ